MLRRIFTIYCMNMNYSVNERAAALFWSRPNWIPFDQPCELGYHCPVCEYPHYTSPWRWSYDERLHWSEYNYMLWCEVCNYDYPSILCLTYKGMKDANIDLHNHKVKDELEYMMKTFFNMMHSFKQQLAQKQDEINNLIDLNPN